MKDKGAESSGFRVPGFGLNSELGTRNPEQPGSRIASPAELLRLYLGTPYGRPWNCWQFARHGYALAGWTFPEHPAEARECFVETKSPRAWDLAFFVAPLEPGEIVKARHVGLVIDARYMAHCSERSNGVARGEIERYRYMLRCFLRPREEPCA